MNRHLLLLPAIAVLCFGSATAQKFERKGNKVTYRSNTFEFGVDKKAEAQTVTDPVSGKQVTKTVTSDSVLLKMNGAKIYGPTEVTQKAMPQGANGSVELTIFKGVSSELNKLPNGTYLLYVSNVVIDAKGKIVYYEYDGVSSERNKTKVSPDVRAAVDKKIDSVVNKVPLLKPAVAAGHPVIARTDISLGMFTISVKNHKATMVRNF